MTPSRHRRWKISALQNDPQQTSNIVARAALKLGITQPGVSNAMSRLEDRLGAAVGGHHSPRQLDSGRRGLLDRCRRILADLEEAERVLGRASVTPIGRLRVDPPVSFGRLKMVPLLRAFRQKYPRHFGSSRSLASSQ
jgi:DNA-binding transcriptional LysR family regulator